MTGTFSFTSASHHTVILMAVGVMSTASVPLYAVDPYSRYEISTQASGIVCLEQTSVEESNEGQATPPTHEITRQTISDLRRLSGLTWEQLGELFGVSRRTVHFWASGKAMNADHARHLMAVFDTVARSQRQDAASTRALLFTVGGDGKSAFELLRDNRIPDAVKILGTGSERKRVVLTPLSTKAQDARRPLSPFELLDTVDTQVPIEARPGRAARTVRVKREKA